MAFRGYSSGALPKQKNPQMKFFAYMSPTKFQPIPLCNPEIIEVKVEDRQTE
jgi:hypothetical protein